MTDEFVRDLLQLQGKALDNLPEHYFDGAADGQDPDYVLSVCADSREHPDLTMGMRYSDLDTQAVSRAIGANIIVHTESGQQVVNGTVDYFLGAGVDTVVIADHYGCGAVKESVKAYLANNGEPITAVDGITADAKPISQFIHDAVTDGELHYDQLESIDFNDAEDNIWAECVRHNVAGQVQFLQDRLPELKEKHDAAGHAMADPEDIRVYGAVNDFLGKDGAPGHTHFY